MNKHGVYKNGEKKFASVYYHMRDRCNNKSNKEYHNYGGRGIKCLRDVFENFFNDMYPSYIQHCRKYGKANTTLDRIDVDGNYCKENCRWATNSEQAFNKRQKLIVTIDGIEYNARQLAQNFNVSEKVMRYRMEQYNKGKMSYSDLIRKGLKYQHGLTIEGIYYTYEDIVNITGASKSCIETRLRRFKKGDITKDTLFKKVN